MIWLDRAGNQIVETMLATEYVSSIAHSLCKLLVALGDHSTAYIASNISSSSPVSTTTPSTTKGHLTQNFLRLLLVFTGLPGYYGVDEDESEMTLGFWYLLQEALWSTDFFLEDDDEDRRSPKVPETDEHGESQQVVTAKAVFRELVQILRRKVTFPNSNSGWSRGSSHMYNHLLIFYLVCTPTDQIDKFQVFAVSSIPVGFSSADFTF